MKIAILTIGDLTSASTWYRIGQFLPFFKESGLEVDLFQKENLIQLVEALPSYDLLIVQKVLLPCGMIRKILRKAKRVIFDFDDAIWTRPCKDFNFLTKFRVKKRLETWLKGAERVLVANQVLKTYVENFREEATLFPMVIDLIKFPQREETPPAVMGWSGAPHNLSYLEAIAPALKKISFPLAVYSGKKPSFDLPFKHTPFSPGGESNFLKEIGVGLLPLPLDPYAKGKSPIKALQYMAAGIPFVASGEGGVEDLLDHHFSFKATSEKEWVDHLTYFLSHPQKRLEAGKAARSFVEKHHNIETLKHKFLQFIVHV